MANCAIKIVLAIPAFFLGHVIWPPAAGPGPSAAQLPFFMIISALESLMFGFGIAFIFLAYPWVKRTPPHKKARTILAFISLIWILVSWWPHDNLHMHIGMNFQSLLFIEYGFHLTLMITGLILAYYFVTELKEHVKH